MTVSISGYEVVSKLGEGGMGAVFKAVHALTGRHVAIKVLPPELAMDETYRRRFLREARAAGSLNHENITRVYDAGEQSGLYYIVMEYVEGESLANIVDVSGPLDAQYALSIAREVAEGLAHAHEQDIVHRDIKPANIMLSLGRETKITDLGLAKKAEAAQQSPDITLPGTVLGTPRYMPPEQILQPGTVDHRSDVYALGATLYFMLTGAHPFDGGTSPEVMAKVLRETPDYPKELPRPLVRLLRALMAKKPEKRPQNMQKVVGMIEGTLEELRRPAPERPQIKRESSYARPAREKSSRGAVFALLGIAAVVAVVLVVVFGTAEREKNRRGDTAGGEVVRESPPAPPPEPTQRTPVVSEVDEGAKALESALAFVRANPGRRGECIKALRRVAKEYPDHAAAVNAEVQRILDAAREERGHLLAQALELERDGRFDEALKVLRSFAELFSFLEKSEEAASAVERITASRKLLAVLKGAEAILYCDFTGPVVRRNAGYVLSGCKRGLLESGDSYAVALTGEASVSLSCGAVSCPGHLYLRLKSMPGANEAGKSPLTASAGEKELAEVLSITENGLEVRYFDLGDAVPGKGMQITVKTAGESKCPLLCLEVVSPLTQRQRTALKIPPQLVEFKDAQILFDASTPLIRAFGFGEARRICEKALSEPRLRAIREYARREIQDVEALSGLWNLVRDKLEQAALRRKKMTLKFLDDTSVTGLIVREGDGLLVKGAKTCIIEPGTLHPDTMTACSGLSEGEQRNRLTLALLYAYGSFHERARELIEGAKDTLEPEAAQFYRSKLEYLKEKYPAPRSGCPRAYVPAEGVLLLVLDAKALEPVEKGLLELLKEEGLKPRLADVKDVAEGRTKLSSCRVVLVGSFSPRSVKDALGRDALKDEIARSVKRGTDFILLHSGCYVLEILGLAYTEVHHWDPGQDESFYFVSTLVDSNVTRDVPAMPHFPDNNTWQALETGKFDSLAWRVMRKPAAPLYERLLPYENADARGPAFLAEVGSSWNVRTGKSPPTEECLALWQLQKAKVLYFGTFRFGGFWNVDPGNGGGGTLGEAGTKMLVNAVTCAANGSWNLEKVEPAPYEARLWAEISEDLARARRSKDAARAMQNALKLAPRHKGYARQVLHNSLPLRNYTEALGATKQACAKYKSDESLLLREAMVLHLSGKHRSALRRIDSAIKAAGKDEYHRFIKAGILNMLGKTKAARTEALKAHQAKWPDLKLVPISNAEFEKLFSQAQQLFKSGDYERTTQVVVKLVNARPEEARPYNLLGAVTAAKSEFPAALEMLNGAVALNPKLPQVYLNLGYVYTRLGLPEPALAALEVARGLKLTKELEEVHGKLLESANQALQQRESGRRPSYDQGKALFQQRRFKDAISRFALANNLKDCSAYFWMGHSYRQAGRPLKALRQFDKAALIDPAAHDNHHGRGVVLMGLKRYEKAVDAFRECSRLHEKKFGRGHYESWAAIAECYRLLGKAKEADEARRKAQQLKPR